MSTTSYVDFKMQQLSNASTRKVFGRPLEVTQDAASKRVAFVPCLCTWDSPDNPCPCSPSTIWWVLSGDIVSSGASDKKSHNGEPLTYYDINLNAQVTVESVKSSSIQDLTDKRSRIKQLAKLMLLAKIAKAKRANAKASGEPQQSGVIFAEHSSWLGDLWDDLHELVTSYEWSGGDVLVALEVLAIIL
jgi:hypothetical protein